MSLINGDKARSHRVQKARAVRRERMKILREKVAAEAAAAPKKKGAV